MLPAEADTVANAAVIIVVAVKNVGSVDDGLPVLSKTRDWFDPALTGLAELLATYW